MTIDFYYCDVSPPCQTVLLAAKTIGVPLNIKVLDLFKNEHLNPDFVKINPQHMVPTINDNGFILWESRAIITYLQNKYGKNDSLYPKDPEKRAIVDQRLYFDMGTLYNPFGDCYYPMFEKGGAINSEKLQDVNKGLAFLDTFLSTSKYVAGDNLTLADLSLLSTIATIDAFAHDISSYKNILTWYATVKVTPPGFEEAIKKYTQIMKGLVDNLAKK